MVLIFGPLYFLLIIFFAFICACRLCPLKELGLVFADMFHVHVLNQVRNGKQSFIFLSLSIVLCPFSTI